MRARRLSARYGHPSHTTLSARCSSAGARGERGHRNNSHPFLFLNVQCPAVAVLNLDNCVAAATTRATPHSSPYRDSKAAAGDWEKQRLDSQLWSTLPTLTLHDDRSNTDVGIGPGVGSCCSPSGGCFHVRRRGGLAWRCMART